MPPGPPIYVTTRINLELMSVTKEELETDILAGLTVKQLQDKYACSRSSIYAYKTKYELIGLSPNSKKIDRVLGTKICNVCNIDKNLSEFYSNGHTPKGTPKYKAACRNCSSTTTRNSFFDKLKDYLDISGRKYACEKCGYTNVPGSLDFHHLNPLEKDFEISSISRSISLEGFMEKAASEIDKCQILCPNCHRLEHIFMGLNRLDVTTSIEADNSAM